MMNTATEKQISFINKLKDERLVFEFTPDQDGEEARKLIEQSREAFAAGVGIWASRQAWKENHFTSQAASKLIEMLLKAPKRTVDTTGPQAPVRADAPEGMHRFGGHIFKVQRAVHGSGHLYAKALVEDGDGGWTFEYASGAVRNLNESTRLTLEEAKEFGVLYGTCCVCGRTLTDEDSIAAGIGPVCAAKL